MQFNILINKADVNLEIEGDNFTTQVDKVKLVLTKAAMRKIVEEYVELTIGDEKELEERLDNSCIQEIISQMPHLAVRGELYLEKNQLPSEAQKIKDNFNKGWKCLMKLILNK